MKKLTKDRQISYRSRREIVDELDFVAAKLARETQFGGEKLRTGHVVNAVALWLGRLPDAKLIEFTLPLIRDLEVYLDRDEASADEPASQPLDIPTPVRTISSPVVRHGSDPQSSRHDKQPEPKRAPARRGRKS